MFHHDAYNAEPTVAEVVFSLHAILQHLDRGFPELVGQTLTEAVLAVGADVAAVLECSSSTSTVVFSTDQALIGTAIEWTPSSPTGLQYQNRKLLEALAARNSACTAFTAAGGQYAVVLGERASQLNRQAYLDIEATLLETLARLFLRRQRTPEIAQFDLVTDLPDRRATMARIEEVLSSARRTGSRAALLFLDVNNFKEINDSFGHAYGDTVLRDIAAAMRAALRPSEFVGRVGGDEFAAVLPTIDTIEDACKVAKRLSEALRNHAFSGEISPPSLSIGIALFPDHASDQAGWVSAADQAMYAAKRGYLPYSVYEDGVTTAPPVPTVRQTNFNEREFLLCFQPIFDVLTGRVCAAEAFVRWHRASGGLASAEETMERASVNRCESLLDFWVATNAHSYALRWRTLYGINRLHVNLSSGTPKALAQLLGRLAKADVDPAALAFEINVNTLTRDSESEPYLEELAQSPFMFGFDGFGAHTIDLAALQSLPVTFAKLSPSLLPSAAGQKSRTMAAAAAMMKAFGWEVIATRVSSATDRRMILDAGITRMQGFAFAQPMTAVDFEAWLKGETVLASAV